MSTFTYDVALRVGPCAAERPAGQREAKRDGWFKRAFARMIEARQRQAMDELMRHGIKLPLDFDRPSGVATGPGSHAKRA